MASTPNQSADWIDFPIPKIFPKGREITFLTIQSLGLMRAGDSSRGGLRVPLMSDPVATLQNNNNEFAETGAQKFSDDFIVTTS
jgi:hypothetical protein